MLDNEKFLEFDLEWFKAFKVKLVLLRLLIGLTLI